jgi:hypothetical protein
VDALVQHTTQQLRSGLQNAIGGIPTPQLREVEADLRLAGFLTDRTTVTPAGHRYLESRPRRAVSP